MTHFRVGGLLFIALGVLTPATVPFSYDCSKESGFVMDPNEHKRVGYVTDLTGLGLTAALTKDLTVNLPFKPTYPQLGAKQGVNGGPSTVKVVGVIENLTWTGGVGDPIALQFYVSQKNATRLKALPIRPQDHRRTVDRMVDW